MRNVLTTALTTLCMGSQLYGQTPAMEWEHTFDGAASTFDQVRFVRVDNGNNVIVTGASNSPGTLADVVTRKYDPSGNLLWSHTYNNSDYNRADEPFDMELTSTGNVVLIGRTRTSGGIQPNSIGFVYMLDGASGNQVWSDSIKGPGFSGSNFSRLTKAAVNASDEIFVTGHYTGAGSYLMVAAKYSPSGSQLWLQTFDHSTASFHENHGADISLGPDGNVHIGGATVLITNGENFATWKLDPANGDLIWVATKPGPVNNVFTAGIRSIRTDSDGSSYVYGIHSGNEHRVVKYDGQGDEQWSYDFDTIAVGFTASYTGADNHLTFDDSGNIILASCFQPTGSGPKIGVVKFDQAGNVPWFQLLSGTSNNSNEVYAVATDAEGNIFITGSTSDPGFDIATIKLAPDGSEIWRVTRNGSASGNDKGHSLALGSDGAIYVGGLITNATNGDYYVVKYLDGLPTSAQQAPTTGTGLHVFPNPSAERMSISGLQAGSMVTISDMGGKILYRFQSASSSETVNVSDLNSGMYLIQMSGNRPLMTGRFLIQR